MSVWAIVRFMFNFVIALIGFVGLAIIMGVVGIAVICAMLGYQ